MTIHRLSPQYPDHEEREQDSAADFSMQEEQTGMATPEDKNNTQLGGDTDMETMHPIASHGFSASVIPNHYRLKTSGKIGVQLDLPSQGTVTIRADDILGRTISSQDMHYDSGGSYTKSLKNVFYSGGVYFIIVTFNNQTISKTVTVID